jgi:ABC-2 type transport system permease protein
MIDGFRYGFFGVSDIDPALSLGIAAASMLVLTAVNLAMLKRGYKLRQ